MRLSIVAAGLVAGAVLSTSPVLASPVSPDTSTGYTVDASTAAGTTFDYAGTLTDSTSLTLDANGDPSLPCLQAGGTQYCTNAAGVIVVAGSGGVGGSSSNGSTTFGSLLLTISGGAFSETKQIFATDMANGSGSSMPPTSLFLTPTTLSALGFDSFSLVDPTLTFTVSDTMRSDNSGGFGGSFTLSPAAVTVPEPASMALLGVGLVGLSLARRRRRA